MKVLVAGASGVVGRQLLPVLVEHGHDVYGTTTRQARFTEIAAVGATPLLMDGLDAAAVQRAVAEARPDAIVNEMTALNGTPDFRHFDRWFATTNKLRTTGTQNLLAAAMSTGTTRRFITQSYTGWTSAASGRSLATEDEAFDANPLPQQRGTLDSIARMEQLVLRSPFEGVCLRYANLYGPEAMRDMARLLRARRFPIIGGGTGVWSWVHVHDAATATVVALEQAKAGVYNVADDDPAAVSSWLPYLAQVVGAPGPLRVPEWLGTLLAGAVATRMMTRVRGVSNGRLKRELGWRPTWDSWRRGFPDVLELGPGKELAHAVP